MITCTGWTWDHIDNAVTLPQVTALSNFWQHTPPAALQLKRIALALGIKQPEPRVQTSTPATQDALQQAIAAGIPVLSGLPDDPMLQFLDL